MHKLELAPIDGYNDCTGHLFEKTT